MGTQLLVFPGRDFYRLYTFSSRRIPSTIQLLKSLFLCFGRVFLRIPFRQESDLRWNTLVHAWKPYSKDIPTLETRRDASTWSQVSLMSLAPKFGPNRASSLALWPYKTLVQASMVCADTFIFIMCRLNKDSMHMVIRLSRRITFPPICGNPVAFDWLDQSSLGVSSVWPYSNVTGHVATIILIVLPFMEQSSRRLCDTRSCPSSPFDK